MLNATTPVICGGYGSENRSKIGNGLCKCFQMSKRAWTPISPMKECRMFAASVPISSNIGEDADQILVAGGMDQNRRAVLSTVEVFDGSDWRIEPNMALPKPGVY